MPFVPTIPAFNSAHRIGYAVGSAQAQSEGRIEIIVVDGGSTDGTAAVAGGLRLGCPARIGRAGFRALNRGKRRKYA